MKKLVKPLVSIEDYTDEIVQAFCEFEGCNGLCKEHYIWGACISINQVEIDEDILF